jgi:BlaI family penicillinase repressor
MSAIPKNLSKLEWEVMQVIWQIGGKPSVRQVLEKAYANGAKAYTTIQTVMNNLEVKSYLKKEKIGMVNFYKPLHKQDEMVNTETIGFVNKVFGGSFMSLANFLVDSDNLSQEEIDDLKQLIEERTKK